jgi:ketosteroid isomerase-like protein
MSYETPQAAEDAFYDALEEGDIDRLMAVWDDGDDLACLLPMQPLRQGRVAIRETFRQAFQMFGGINIQAAHLQWLSWGDAAAHVLEEQVAGPDGKLAPPVYALNLFRRTPAGWRLVLHQNAPAPPPAGTVPGMAAPTLR